LISSNLYLLISLISLSGISYFFYNFFNIKFNYSLAFSFSTIGIITYLSAIFGFLSIGIFLTNFFGILILIFFFFKKKILLKNFLSNENLKFILLILSSWYFFSHFLFIKEWDEFYWAQYIKSIYSERSVYNIDSPVLMPRRISGISLLQSYFVYFGKDFIEQKIIFVMGLFFFS